MVKYKWFLRGFVCKVADSLFGSGLSVIKALRMSYIVETSKDILKKSPYLRSNIVDFLARKAWLECYISFCRYLFSVQKP